MRFLPFFALFASCGDKPIDGDDDDDTGAPGAECSSDTQCGTGRICEVDTCVAGDRNNAPEEAVEILFDDSRSESINPVNDVDYFTFSSPGGEWVRIATTLTGSLKPGWQLDDPVGPYYGTVVTLRDTNLRVLAFAHVYQAGILFTSTDALLYAYLPAAGDYLIEVEDAAAYYGQLGNGDEDYTYQIELSGANGLATSEPDTFESPTRTVTIESGSTLYPLGGVFASEGDSDFVRVEVPYDNTYFAIFGAEDRTGQTPQPDVQLFRDDGAPMSAPFTIGDGRTLVHPSLPQGTYIVELKDGSGAFGAANWMFGAVRAYGDDTDRAPEVEPNDDIANANVLETVEGLSTQGNPYDAGEMHGFADGPGDVDWIAVDGRANGYLNVCVVTTYRGSTLLPNLEVTDAAGNVLASDEGVAGFPTAQIIEVPTSADRYYIKVISPESATGGPDAWWQAEVLVTTSQFSTYTCP